jgi:hypothetical protein
VPRWPRQPKLPGHHASPDSLVTATTILPGMADAGAATPAAKSAAPGNKRARAGSRLSTAGLGVWGAAKTRAPLTAAILLLLAGAAASMLAPLGGAGCPGALAALSSTAKPLPSGSAPAEDQATVDADSRALSDAEGKSRVAQAALTQAVSDAQKASDLQSKADQARNTASATSDGLDPFAVQSDQMAVDSDTSSLGFAQSVLKSSQDMLPSDQQYGVDTTYAQQAILDAQAQVNDAKNQLTKDQTKLSADKQQADRAAASARAAQGNADNLSKQAKDAEAKAQAARGHADAAASDVSSANATQRGNQEAAVAAASDWYRQHRLAVAESMAANTAASDCKTPATRNGLVGAGLALAALMLFAAALLRRTQNS